VDPVVGIDLIAERAGAAAALEMRVELLAAVGDVVVVAPAAGYAGIPIGRADGPAVLQPAVHEVPRTTAGFDERARRGPAGLEDDVDHAAHVLAAVDHRGGAAHDFDALDIGERQFREVGGAGAVAVDQDENLALEIAALAFGGAAADVE